MRALSAFCAALVILAGSAAAQTAEPGRLPLERLTDALAQLERSYGDVPSSVNCSSGGRTKAQAVICADPYLAKAELLSTRAQAYARENATKTEVDRATFKGELPICSDPGCVYRFLERQTDDALGGESPYYKARKGD